ncbi:hypothetical protein [Deinococcus aquaedulcis]|uniref:hypothetical protein n=1 Tax=Deinococcus aquaedulcis TaxID=2840455 RepID=UPI001C82FF3E|nr:hypothetical protein [Deinococcus aquaedulcis]
MRHLLALLLLTQSAALACLPPSRSPAMMSAERALNALRTGQACPNVVEDPCTRTYRAAPQEVARLLAQQANTVARRSGEVWTVVLDEYRGQRVQIRAGAGGTQVVQSDWETAYETLLSRMATATEAAGHDGKPVTCTQLGVKSDRVLAFEQCRVSWAKAQSPLPGQPFTPTIHFTLSRVSDSTLERAVAYTYTPLTWGGYPCASPLDYEER